MVNHGHYTSPPGLIGIIQSETIRATNIKFLNDGNEFNHALELIKKIIPKAKISSDHPNHSVYLEFVKKITEQLESLDGYEADNIFTFSFSEEPDLLSQWRGYCPGNNGYCIVFDTSELHEIIKVNFHDCHLVKCVYDNEQKEAQLKKLLNDYYAKYIKVQEKKVVIEQFKSEIMFLASYFKHPSFTEEREHRIVILLEYATDNDLKFREARFSLMPYIELSAPKRTIKKILIGPTAQKQLAKRALEAFLEKSFGVPTFVGGVDVEFSKTPYRPW